MVAKELVIHWKAEELVKEFLKNGDFWAFLGEAKRRTL